MAIGKSGYELRSVREARAASGGRPPVSDSKHGGANSGEGWQHGLKTLAAAPVQQAVRMEKAAEIRAALAAGRYWVSAWDVAAKMCALGGAAMTGRDASGNQGGRAESWKSRRDGLMAPENCLSSEEFIEGAEEVARANWDGEWRRMPEVLRMLGSTAERMNRASGTKLGALVHAWSICATMRERYRTSLFRSRRSKRSLPEMQ
ncbi:MAG TPA: flagellar biosynthesis anti-sigma factor FlgM [Terracidiphilus sp.]